MSANLIKKLRETTGLSQYLLTFHCWQYFAKWDEQPVWWWLLPQGCCVLCCVWPHPLPQISELAWPLCELTWEEEGQQTPILLLTLVKLNRFREDPAGAGAKHWQKEKSESRTSHSWLPWGGQVSWDAASSSRLKLSNMKWPNVLLPKRGISLPPPPIPSWTVPPLPHTAWAPCKADSPSTLGRHWQVFLPGCS